MFNHLKKLKNTIIININFSQRAIVKKICQVASNKLSKYYSKIKDSNEIIYNLA